MFALSAQKLRLPIQASAPSTLGSSLRRWIYNPTLQSPPLKGPALQGQFRLSTAPHLQPEQFQEGYRPNAWGGIITPIKVDTHVDKAPPEEIWKNRSAQNLGGILPPPNRFDGRSVTVDRGVGQAWIRLQAILKQNNIRRELRLTQRHEKKGVKRRRLLSERWRRRFAEEVRKKVKLVNEIRQRDRMWGASRH